jgi:hypothetical protein
MTVKTIRIIRNWDWPDLMKQTPQCKGVWGNFHFTEEAVSTCDYVVILNNLSSELQTQCPVKNIWRVVQEPPVEFFKPWHLNPSYAFKSFTCDPDLSGPQYVRSQPMLPWHLNRDFDFLHVANLPIKTKQLSWVTSTKRFLEGHKRRMRFLHAISGKIKQLDLLGGGNYPIAEAMARIRNEEEKKNLGFKPIEDKWEGLAPYKYSLAIENEVVPDYWSEKIADCFLSWTLPIYYGCMNLEDYFPKDSFIRIDIENPEEAIDIIEESLRDDPWDVRLPAIIEARRLVLYKYQLFPAITRHILELEEYTEREK